MGNPSSVADLEWKPLEKIMSRTSEILPEQKGPTPKEIRIYEAFHSAFRSTGDRLTELEMDADEVFLSFLDAAFSNGLVVLSGTEGYDREMKMAGKNAMRRPFGIELNTLSPSIQLVLYPQMTYPPLPELIEYAQETGGKVRTEGPQAMLYVLNRFEKEVENVEDLAVNLVFVGHMAEALLEGRYPLDEGERSSEFLQEVRAGLMKVKEYLNLYFAKLKLGQDHNLSPRIERIKRLDESGLNQEAENIVLYQTEPMKQPGLIEGGLEERFSKPLARKEKAIEAVANHTSLLHCSERTLPLKKVGTSGSPQPPWVEYSRDRYTRDFQLFGRYELALEERVVRVDYALDSTYFPAKYGFFHALEITDNDPSGIQEHIILVQDVVDEMDLKTEVYPLILAGDFDFSDSVIRKNLERLAADKGTKREIALVLRDILSLSESNNLPRNTLGYHEQKRLKRELRRRRS